MKLFVYVPERLEARLRREAADAKLSLTKFIQSVLKDRLEGAPNRSSQSFAELAGSWEDERTTGAVLRNIEKSWAASRRQRPR